MKNLFKPVLAASLALSVAMPFAPSAQAQVAGIASSTPEVVFVRSAARIAAYEQINNTYTAQISQITAKRNEVNTLQKSLDTNNDNQLSQAEVDANSAVVGQIEAKQKEIETISVPIVMAQYYVIEQLLNDYSNAESQVIKDKKIQIMLTPDAFQYRADGVDVTEAILAVVDKRLPNVSATPPAGYRPRQATAQMHQAVQQILLGLAQRQAAQQQAEATQPAAPAGR